MGAGVGFVGDGVADKVDEGESISGLVVGNLYVVAALPDRSGLELEGPFRRRGLFSPDGRRGGGE